MIGRRTPRTPVNARLVALDGRVIPLELVYVGRRRRIHRWRNVHRVVMEASDDKWALQIDVLPPRTEVALDIFIIQ